MMKKILSILLMVISIISLTSCGNKINKFSEFKDAMSKEYESITFDKEMIGNVKRGGTTTNQSAFNLNVKMDNDKTSIKGTVEGDSKIELYSEGKNDNLNFWVESDGEWLKNAADLYLYYMFTSYPSLDVEEGDFEYKKGVWVANIDKIEDKLIKSLDKFLGISSYDNLDIKQYDITFDKENISKIEIRISAKVTYDAEITEYDISYIFNFRDHNNTKVERPEGLPN